MDERGFLSEVLCFNERRRVNLKFEVADLVYNMEELRSRCLHLNNRYVRIVLLSAWLLDLVKDPTDRALDSPFFRVKHMASLQTTLSLHQAKVYRSGLSSLRTYFTYVAEE